MVHGKNEPAAFSLAEVLVALAIIAVLGAVLLPALNGKLRESRTSAISQSLNGISLGMAEYKKAMGRYPGQLTMLTTTPTTSQTDICGNTVPSTSTALWRGPYISREFIGGGIPMGDGLIYSGVRRLPTTVTSTPPNIVYALIDVGGVELTTASDLDTQLDGGDGAFAGTIRWTASNLGPQTGAGVNQTIVVPAVTATNLANVTYAIPINPTGC